MNHQISIEIKNALNIIADPAKAIVMSRFFKTNDGEYGAGDTFLGIKVPDQRAIAKSYYDKITLEDIRNLLATNIHEFRLTAIFILVLKYSKAKTQATRKEILDFYLHQRKFINNWDIVDSSTKQIVGHYAFTYNQPEIMVALGEEEALWSKRIAIVGTLYYIKKSEFELPLLIISQHLHHQHDLIQKANGWMLKEIGNINEEIMMEYLVQNYQQMPRTTLRYAIEKLDENIRQQFLKGLI